VTSRTAVVAFGGNALVTDAAHDSIPQQYETVCQTVPHLVDMIEQDWRLVVSHGNGPQAGFILRRSELAGDEVDPVPVDYAVADTQGAIGYMFVKALGNELRRRGLEHPVVALVTQSVVDRGDPAFGHPSKPVGSFLSEATARDRAAALGWTITEDAGRGWRRTVPSPRPRRIIETPVIRTLLDQGAIVVAAGGGGIPVAPDDAGNIAGVEAVVDKDLAASLLAVDLGADLLLIPTGVPRVAIGFGTPGQQWLDTLTVEEARGYIKAGEFGAGSMEPKVAAVADFVAAVPGAAGVIGAPDQIPAMLAGNSGTRIVNTSAGGAPDGAVLLAVNGTLMRGFKLNSHMAAAKAAFVREASTEPVYRLWSIHDEHPAMLHVTDGSGAALKVEVWAVPKMSLAGLLQAEPPGLAVGKIRLDDGSTVFGVLSESALVEGEREITEYGGWRAYAEAEGISQ
jgi:carbamate kinase